MANSNSVAQATEVVKSIPELTDAVLLVIQTPIGFKEKERKRKRKEKEEKEGHPKTLIANNAPRVFGCPRVLLKHR